MISVSGFFCISGTLPPCNSRQRFCDICSYVCTVEIVVSVFVGLLTATAAPRQAQLLHSGALASTLALLDDSRAQQFAVLLCGESQSDIHIASTLQ